MPPHEGLAHLKEYDWRDSNVELVNSELDHKVKHQSAATEPAWNNGAVGAQPGLFIWRIEDFEVVPWPKEKYGQFHEGDSYIVLHSEAVKPRDGGAEAENEKKLVHDIFFWLGSHTSQDEAGTAAYKTVELDEFLHGAATQHRELQSAPSDAFGAVFPRLKILRGGVKSGFTHVETNEEPAHTDTLLRIFKHPSASARDAVLVHEVEPTWKSLDEDDVFVLDKGDKIFVWQGRKCSPMEKLKAAQVVHDLTVAKHVDTEVLSQSESRSKVVVDYLGGQDVDTISTQFQCPRPVGGRVADERQKQLFRISDEEGRLSFDKVKEGKSVGRADFEGDDVFLLDSGRDVWIWEGKGASRAEKAAWIKIVQRYLGQLGEEAASTSVSKVHQGNEGRAFWTAVES